MKYVLSFALAIAAMTTGAAAQRDKDIVVTSKPITLADWSKKVSTALDRGLSYPVSMYGGAFASGVVAVRFRCSEDGRPTAISVFRTSGDRALDRAAMRAVHSVKTLHPMPANLKPDQQYEANILFATSYADYNRQMTILKREAARRNSWFSDADRVIALNIGLKPSGQM